MKHQRLKILGECLQLEVGCRGYLLNHKETVFLGNHNNGGKLGGVWRREVGKMEVFGNDLL